MLLSELKQDCLDNGHADDDGIIVKLNCLTEMFGDADITDEQADLLYAMLNIN